MPFLKKNDSSSIELARLGKILARFPKQRPELPQAHQDIFAEEYKANREGKNPAQSIAQRLEQWMHRKVARGANGANVLEIGAGTLNHLPFEAEFETYDIIEPFRFLFEDSPHLKVVSNVFDDISELPSDVAYDRIISIAVLEHLTHLPTVIAQSGLSLNKAGVFQAGIPCEGEFLWGAAWRFSTGIEYKIRTGLSYAEVMRHEHINTAAEIFELTRHFFDNVKISRFPLPLPHLSFYAYIEAQNPREDRCREFLAQQGAGLEADK